MDEGESPVRRPRGRPRKGADGVSIEAILEAALHAFATYGYQGMSMRTLNRELGVSHNLLHQRFSSKEQLWYTAVDWGLNKMVESLITDDDEDIPQSERIARIIKNFATFAAHNSDLLRIIDIEAGQDSPRLQHICDGFMKPLMGRLFPIYDEAIAAGTLRSVPQSTVFFLITSATAAPFSSSAIARNLFGDEVLTPEQIEHHTNEVADLILRGLQP